MWGVRLVCRVSGGCKQEQNESAVLEPRHAPVQPNLCVRHTSAVSATTRQILQPPHLPCFRSFSSQTAKRAVRPTTSRCFCISCCCHWRVAGTLKKRLKPQATARDRSVIPVLEAPERTANAARVQTPKTSSDSISGFPHARQTCASPCQRLRSKPLQTKIFHISSKPPTSAASKTRCNTAPSTSSKGVRFF